MLNLPDDESLLNRYTLPFQDLLNNVNLNIPDPMAFESMLSDTEIVSLISEMKSFDEYSKNSNPNKPIMIKNHVDYLKKYRTKLIQPSSQDVMLKDFDYDSDYSLFDYGENKRKVDFLEYQLNPNDFITFPPHSVIDIIIDHPFEFELFGPVRNNISLMTESRSTLKRIGLDISTSAMGSCAMYNGEIHIPIRNTQSYSVSIEKGTKVAQFLWQEKIREEGCNFENSLRANRISNGYIVNSKEYLEEIIKQGDIKFKVGNKYISPDIVDSNFPISCYLKFHASNLATTNSGKDIFICKDKTTYGVKTYNVKQSEHKIIPGQFIDILTEESLELSSRVGIHIHYISNHQDYLERSFTSFESRGGWIDPGYNGVFSVQRKTKSEEEIIFEGDCVAVGTVYFYPNGVGLEYGNVRGSNYNNATKTLFKQKK